MVKVADRRAGREVKSLYGGAYNATPSLSTVEEASSRGILQVDAEIG